MKTRRLSKASQATRLFTDRSDLVARYLRQLGANSVDLLYGRKKNIPLFFRVRMSNTGGDIRFSIFDKER